LIESIAQTAWPFVHPAIAAAAAGTALVPILIHLINRRRYRRVEWAAMSFLLAASRSSRRRIRLEQWLLMLLRILVVVLLGLAVARPYLPASPLSVLGRVRSHHVILLDNSRSMNARDETGQTGFQRASAAAQQLVDALPTGDPVSLITLARPAEAVIDHPAHDRRFLRERIRNITPTQRATDTVGGLGLALGMIRESRAAAANPHVHVISDLPAHEWSTEEAAAAPPAIAIARALMEEGKLALIRTAPANTDNLAVTRLAPGTRLIGVNRPVRMSVEVTNCSDRLARGAALQIMRDGQIIRRVDLGPIGPGEVATASIPTVFAGPGTHAVTARVIPGGPDSLDDDDERHASIEVRRVVPVLLVDERSGPGLLDGSAGYLAVALAPRSSPGADSLIEPKIISEPELTGEALDDYDVIALCNVGRPGEVTWRRLAEFVERGGGLLVFPGDLVGADSYNRFAGPRGADLLPGTLAEPVGSSEKAERYFTLSPEGLTHPIVAEFGDVPDSGLFLAHVRRYMPIDPDPDRDEVVLRYTHGPPAIVQARRGAGRVVAFTFTADMRWNNLPAKGDFVSLMANTIAYATPGRGEQRNVRVGDTPSEPLTARQTGLTPVISGPSGRSLPGRLVPRADGLDVAFGPIERAGIWPLSIGPDVLHYAVNVDAEDSTLVPVERSEIEASLGRDVAFVSDSQTALGPTTPGGASEFATITVCLVLLLLFVEALCATRFGTHGQGLEGRHGGLPHLREGAAGSTRPRRAERVEP
jgi:uncharacterized membrane protein